MKEPDSLRRTSHFFYNYHLIIDMELQKPVEWCAIDGEPFNQSFGVLALHFRYVNHFVKECRQTLKRTVILCFSCTLEAIHRQQRADCKLPTIAPS